MKKRTTEIRDGDKHRNSNIETTSMTDVRRRKSRKLIYFGKLIYNCIYFFFFFEKFKCFMCMINNNMYKIKVIRTFF